MRILFIYTAILAADGGVAVAQCAQCEGQHDAPAGPEIISASKGNDKTPPGVNIGPDDDGWYWNEEGRYRWRWVDAKTRKPLEARDPVQQNFGVDLSKLSGPNSRYLRKGKQITREEALGLVGNKDIPDDASKLRLTVIGSEDARKAVLADLVTSPLLAPWAGKLSVQAYDPSHWAVAAFAKGPETTIYLQKPDGTVLHRQDDYTDGAAGLATALRRADPNYDPTRDPDARKSNPGGLTLPFDLSKVPTSVWVLGGIGVLLLLKKEEKA